MSSDQVPNDLALRGVLETCLYVDDLEEAERFYRDVLGLRLESRHPGRHVFFYCGDQMLLLFAPESTNSPESKLPRHGATGASHVAFRVPAEELDAWAQRLVSQNVPIEQTANWSGGFRSVYFRDPAGNSLEFACRGMWGVAGD